LTLSSACRPPSPPPPHALPPPAFCPTRSHPIQVDGKNQPYNFDLTGVRVYHPAPLNPSDPFIYCRMSPPLHLPECTSPTHLLPNPPPLPPHPSPPRAPTYVRPPPLAVTPTPFSGLAHLRSQPAPSPPLKAWRGATYSLPCVTSIDACHMSPNNRRSLTHPD
jgi:hypothetical protein